MRSLAEIGALVEKAARGAGYPHGVAADFGTAAKIHLGSGGDAAAITAALREEPTKVDLDWQAEVVIIHGGPMILIGPVAQDAFGMGCNEIVLDDAGHVPLLQAYLSAAGYGSSAEGNMITHTKEPAAAPAPGPVAVPEAHWQAWEALAAETFVPESAASRSAGAGAGLTDND